jgi:hypothetical protein
MRATVDLGPEHTTVVFEDGIVADLRGPLDPRWLAERAILVSKAHALHEALHGFIVYGEALLDRDGPVPARMVLEGLVADARALLTLTAETPVDRRHEHVPPRVTIIGDKD